MQRLSLPAGFLLGALAGVLGLSDQILGAL
jgi:hypothetical protein